MFRLLLQELRFRRNAMIGWGLALCFFPIVYVGLYPSFADQMSNFEEMMDLAIYQAMGISMSGFEDYMASTVTNLVSIWRLKPLQPLQSRPSPTIETAFLVREGGLCKCWCRFICWFKSKLRIAVLRVDE
jgi:hypothetical protein